MTRRQVSRGTTLRVVFGALLILAVYVGYRAWEQRRGDDRVTDVADPINVPLLVDPETVRYETRFNFTFDTVEALAAYRESEQLDSIIDPDDGTFDRVLALLHWTRLQWQPGRPDPYPPINAQIILNDIRAGRTGGFCAQYNYVFVQAVQSFGIPARYVSVRGHEVTEVWVPELDKWVCFDPLHDAYYTDAQGAPLSVHDIYVAVRRREPVRIVGDHQRGEETEQEHLDRFQTFAVWIKNDHLSAPINYADIRYHKVYYVEKGEESAGPFLPALNTSSLTDLYFRPDLGS